MTAKQKLKNMIANLDSEIIHTCLDMIGSGHVSAEERIVRAYMIDEIERRHGEDAADAAMDRIGL
jgi:CRISPR/Cas system type I-B associated protein Csh2 (Cas7 group RAMP superfamily)